MACRRSGPGRDPLPNPAVLEIKAAPRGAAGPASAAGSALAARRPHAGPHTGSGQIKQLCYGIQCSRMRVSARRLAQNSSRRSRDPGEAIKVSTRPGPQRLGRSPQRRDDGVLLPACGLADLRASTARRTCLASKERYDAEPSRPAAGRRLAAQLNQGHCPKNLRQSRWRGRRGVLQAWARLAAVVRR